LASCGAVVGVAMIVAISPSSLIAAGGAASTPGVLATACWSALSWPAVPAASLGVSIASRNGPFEPGPNAAVSWS
jgi:hypothetical protein